MLRPSVGWGHRGRLKRSVAYSAATGKSRCSLALASSQLHNYFSINFCQNNQNNFKKDELVFKTGAELKHQIVMTPVSKRLGNFPCICFLSCSSLEFPSLLAHLFAHSHYSHCPIPSIRLPPVHLKPDSCKPLGLEFNERNTSRKCKPAKLSN